MKLGRRLLSVLLNLALFAQLSVAAGTSAKASDASIPVPPITSPATKRVPEPINADFSPRPQEKPLEVVPSPQPPSAPAKKEAAIKGFVEGVSEELTAERRADLKIYSNPDGTRTARVFSGPVHFQDASGAWRDIDTKLVISAPGRYSNGGNSFSLDLSANPTDPNLATIRIDASHSVGFSVQGAGTSIGVPVTEDNKIAYPEILPHTTLELTSRVDGLKEELILSSRDAPTTFTFPLSVKGLNPELAENGDVVYRDEAGTPRVISLHGFMEDSNVIPESQEAPRSYGVTYEIVLLDDGTEALKVSLDAAWLNAPERVYPVRVDPSYFNSTTQEDDTYVMSNTIRDNASDLDLKVGTYDGGGHLARSFMNFNVSQLNGKAILSAVFSAWNFHSWSCDARGMGVYRVTQPWGGHTMTGYPGATLGERVAWAAFAKGYSAACPGGWASFEITDTVRNWTSGAWGQFGLAMTVDSGSESDNFAWKKFSSWNESGGGWSTPHIDIDYNTAPSMAQPVSPPAPGNGANIHTQTPTLAASASDSDGDAVQYYYRLALGSDAESNVVWDSDWTYNTSVTTPTLNWNTTYYWHVYSHDGYWQVNPNWVWSFRTVNSPPPTPSASSPTDDSISTSTQPALSVSPVTDPDGDGVRYFFRVSQSADAQNGGFVDSGWITQTSWTPPNGVLSDGVKYYWTVSARDDITYWAQSGWGNPRSLRIDLGLGEKGSRPFDRVGPAGVNLSNGNVVLSTSSPSISALGGPIGLSYSYNSQTPPITGLRGVYFNDSNQNGLIDPTEKSALVRVDPQVNFDWQTGSPNSAPGVSDSAAINPDWFLVRWKGFITVPVAGSYQFGRKSDDATRIWIDGQLYRDGASWMYPTDPVDYGAAKTLTALQTVEVTIEYNEVTGPSFVQLWVKGPIGAGGAQAEAIIPASWLTTNLPGLPDGWMMSADPDGDLGYTQARIGETSVVLVDATGGTHKYRKTLTSAGSAWEPEEDEEGVLANDTSTGLLVLHADDGRVYNFTSAGLLSSVVSPLDDRKPAAPVYTWSGSPSRLTQIKDPLTSRAITLIYNTGVGVCPATPAGYTDPPSQMLCRVDYTEFGGGVTNLYYSNGHVARIEDPGGELTDFGYDTAGRLIQFRDPLTNDLIAAGKITDGTSDTHKTQIAYAAGKATSITAPMPAVGALRPQHSYEYVISTVTKVHVAGLSEPNGYARQITTNASGQLAQERDVAGKATTFEWDSDDRLKRKTDPTDIAQTTIYDAAGRPTDNYGPGKSSEFGSDGTSTTAPRSRTFYDESLQGLGAAWWDQPGLVGPPKSHSTLAGWADWGSGSPSPGVIPGEFSGRLTGEINVATAGTYTFTADVDRNDGVRVFVDDRAVINRWDPYRETVLKDSPVSFWRLGEAAGATVAADEKNIAAGSYLGGVSLAQAGAVQSDPNSAASFDGTDDRVSVPHTASLSLTRFTVETWVFPQSIKSDWQPIIVKENSTGGTRNYGLFIIPNSMALHYSFQDADCATWRSFDSNYAMSLNQWNHVAMTYDGSSFKLYLNGALDSTRSVSSNPCQNAEPVKMAKEVSAYTGFLGRLDEVAIFNTALSDSRVASHYAAGQAKLSGPTPTSLAAGAHRIRVDYEDPGGSAKLQLSWNPLGTNQVIPFSVLKPRYGLATTQIDADGKKTATEYATPEVGLPTAVIIDPGALNLRSETGYEAVGSGYFRRLWRKLPKGESTKVSYDYYTATETADNPCTGVVEAIPQGGMLKSTTSADPDGAATTHSSIVREVRYDEQGRVVASRVVGDLSWSCITYDTRGRVTSRTDSQGKKTNIDYSVPGQVTTSFPDSSGANRTTVSTTDWLGRGLSYTDEHGTTTRVVYDQAGRITDTYRKFSGQTELRITHNDYAATTGRLSALTEYVSGAGRTTTFTYDDAGRLLTTTRPNGVATTNAFDVNRGWLNSISNKKGTVDLGPFPWTYTRNPSGDVASEQNRDRTRNYVYDRAGRLNRVTEGAVTRNYSYDANSNRCSTSTTCNGSYTYDSADRLLSSPFATGYSYDAHGNLISANPISQPPAGSLNQSFAFDASQSAAPHDFPIVVGQAGDVTSTVAWSPTPYASGSPTGTVAANSNKTHAVAIAGKSQTNASISWTQGTKPQSTSPTGTVTAGGTSSQSISPTGSGTISASLDWNSLPTYANYTFSGSSLGPGATVTRSVVAKGESFLSASLTWTASSGVFATTTLRLKNPAGSVVKVLNGTGGGPLRMTYLAPDPGGTYIFEIQNTHATKSMPTYSMPHSSTTVSTSAISGLIGPLQTWTKPLTADGQGYLSADLTWAQGKRTQTDTVTNSLTQGSNKSFSITPTTTGAINAALDWAALPVYVSNSPSGSLLALGSTSTTLTAKGSSYLSSSITWSKGERDETSSFSGTLDGGGNASHSVAPTATGTVSASVDWASTLKNSSWSGFAEVGSPYETVVTSTASGPLSVTLTWPSEIPVSNCDDIYRPPCVHTWVPNDADLDVYLLDASTRTKLASSESIGGYSESISYTVPSSVTYSSGKAYVLQVKAKATGSNFSLSSSYPVTADVDIELWSGSTKVASSYSTTAKPETISVSNRPPGSYSIKVISKDHQANYSLSSTYRIQQHADLTLRLKNPSGAVVKTTRGSTGSLSIYFLAPAPGGTYTIEVINNSSNLAVPSYTLPHSATTVLIEAITGNIAPGGKYPRSVAAADRGVIAADLTWTRGTRPRTDTINSSVAGNGSSDQYIYPDGTGTLSAQLNWSPTSNSGSWGESVGAADQKEYVIKASASGQISATLIWPSQVPNPDLDLYLVDYDNGNVLVSREALVGNSESFNYSVSHSYSSQKRYKLRVKAKATGSSFTLSTTYPVTPELDLELYNSSNTKIASSYSAANKPENVSIANQSPGTYKWRVISRDYPASYTLTPTYPTLAYANVTLRLKSGSATVASQIGASGSLHIDYLAPAAGSYTLEAENNSTDLNVPEFNLTLASPERHYANLDLELYNPSGAKVAETTGTARPESLSYPSGVAGTYTIKVLSRDWEASSFTLTPSYQMAAHAPITAKIKNSSGTPVVTQTASAGSLSIDYLAPSPGSYTLELQNTSTETAVPSMTGTSSSPKTRYPDLDLKLKNGSGAVVATSATSSRPESLTYNASPGSYTIEAISKNWEASYTMAVSYPVVAHADVTFSLKSPTGTVVASDRKTTGSASLSHLTTSGGNYILQVTNNSTDLSVPSYTINYSLQSTVTLALKDSSGAVIKQNTGSANPKQVTATALAPGAYTVSVTPTGGIGTATATAIYPGRPANEVITYDGNDHATSVDDGTNTVVETLSPSGRVLRRVVTDDATGQVSEDTTFGYDDDGDSPAYSKPTAGGAVTTYIAGADGDLLVIDTGGTPTYPIQNGHDDIVGTTDANGVYTANPVVDEFGVGDPPANRLGWLGAKERFSTGGNLHLVRFGARLYDPALGRFLQVDPLEGASANSYDYCLADPINCVDLDGQAPWWRTALKVAAIVGGIAGAVACGATIVCGIAVGAAAGAASYAATNAGTRNWNWGGFALETGLGAAFGGRIGNRGIGVGSTRLAIHKAHKAIPATLKGGLKRKASWVAKHHQYRPHVQARWRGGNWRHL